MSYDFFDWNELSNELGKFGLKKTSNDDAGESYDVFLKEMEGKKVPNPKDSSSQISVSSLRHERYAPEGPKIFKQMYEQWKGHKSKSKDSEKSDDQKSNWSPTDAIKKKIEEKKQKLLNPEKPSDSKSAPQLPKKEEWSPASAIKKKEESSKTQDLQKKIEEKKNSLSKQEKTPSDPKQKVDALIEDTQKENADRELMKKHLDDRVQSGNVSKEEADKIKKKLKIKDEPVQEKPVDPKEQDIIHKIDSFVEQQQKKKKERELVEKHINDHIQKRNLTPEEASELKKHFGLEDQDSNVEPSKKVKTVDDVASHASSISKEKFNHSLWNVKQNSKRLRGNVSSLPDPQENAGMQKEIHDKVSNIGHVFKSRGIESDVKDVTVGPNFTTYHMEIDPDNYKKVIRGNSNKIISDLISLKSGVHDTRIELNKQKGTLDVQIPNQKRQIVPWKQLVTDPDYLSKVHNDPEGLHASFGQDNNGKTKSIDLNKEPHVGIVGGTGSGKTVTMNGILSSMIATKKPEDLQMSIVDVGKQGAGFKDFNGVSNMAQPVIDNEDDAHSLFRDMSSSIDSRNQLIKQVGGDISDFNRFIKKDPQTMTDQEKKILESIPSEQRKPIPRHVIAVDEFADLMRRYETGKERQEFVKNVVQIAQLGRSAGVHLVLATQHPNDRSLPKDIWRQLGTRLVHKVNDESASEYVGVKDAHKLAKHGDMLAVSDGVEDRVQSGYLSNEKRSFRPGEKSDLETFLSSAKGKNPIDVHRFDAPERSKEKLENKFDRIKNDIFDI